MRLRKKRNPRLFNRKRKSATPRTPTWCRGCGRKHSRDVKCKVKRITKVAKSGRVVRRWKAI